VSARLVAGGALLIAGSFVLAGWTALVVVLAYGFVARVLAGPRLSPLGLLVTSVLRPRLPISRAPRRPVPGPPKRFAQGIEATLSTLALVLALVGAGTGARVAAALIVGAAGAGVARQLLRRLRHLPSPHAGWRHPFSDRGGTRAGRRAPSCDQLVAGPTRSAGPGSLWGPQQAAP
jgi:hypothetical protein